MATLIPPFFGQGPHSEQTVFRALERGLPAEWVVWWSLAYSAIAGGADGEGEIDFLCAHPRHGLVAIEVKGGMLDCRDGQWFQDGRRLREPPHLQATRHAHALRTILCRRLGRAPLPFALAHAVWLPDAARPAAEPLPLAGITLYAADLADPGPALLRLLTRAAPPCAAPPDLATLRALLSPSVSFRPDWRHRRTLADARIARLTHEQARAFDAFAAFPRLRVRGCAGSGKTLLALRRAGLRARLRAILERLVHAQRIPPGDILLLGAHALHRMALADILLRFPGLRYYTYRKFKGLEAPVLILLDVTERDPLWNRPALYTAISRAIHTLVILRLRPA